jgi:predicted solute-binding protein
MALNMRGASAAPLQLGWIPYFNLLPFRIELERLSGADVDWHRGVPAQVNKWLTEGKVSLAPCSSICLLRHSHHEIALPLGVAAMGPVASVYLGLHHEDAGLVEVIRERQAMLREAFKSGEKRELDARKVADLVFKVADSLPPIGSYLPPPLVVTPASATSATLGRILYRLWFGESAYEMRASQHNISRTVMLSDRRPMELLIGDEALAKRPQFRAIVDLSEAWRELTDLPFVFAVWQKTRQAVSPQWRQRIFEAAEIAQARMRVEPSHYLPDMPAMDVQGHSVDLAGYWKLIQYRLGPQHFKGLALFLALARNLAPDLVDHQGVVNITRWEALGQSQQFL